MSHLKKSITLPGICALCPEIEIEGHLFCFTGISSRASRSTIAKEIEVAGGNYIAFRWREKGRGSHCENYDSLDQLHAANPLVLKYGILINYLRES